MRQRKVKNVDEIFNDNTQVYIFDANINKGKWLENIKSAMGQKYKELHIEVGMGKGSFVTQTAINNPDNLYIGIELDKSVMALAIKKINKYIAESNNTCSNVRFISVNANTLEDVFEKREIDKIYLNFSDPWPKTKHEKRRLTSDSFIGIYKKILKEECSIEIKTDNRKLFEYSILNLNKNKVNMEYISLDLHKEDVPNIVTEYEDKFSKFGPIYKMVFKF